MRVCANGQIVTRSRSHPLETSFKVDVKEAFGMRFAKWPNRISLQIFPAAGQLQYPLLTSSLLADVKIDVPGIVVLILILF